MKYTAEAKNIKVSPRKMRLVVEGVKKMPITRALATLDLSPTSAASPIKKALMSAIANAVNNGKIDRNTLFISEMFVNEGLSYKRFHFAGRGRTRPYKKRTSHLKVILQAKEVAVTAPVVVEKTEKTKKGESK